MADPGTHECIFLDVIQGLTTLKLFNASRQEAEMVAAISERYRRQTMSVLRVAFLSSFMLEFLSTVGIALVAVFIGFACCGARWSSCTACMCYCWPRNFTCRCAVWVPSIMPAWKPSVRLRKCCGCWIHRCRRPLKRLKRQMSSMSVRPGSNNRRLICAVMP
ncbi:MAG: ABC transporter transmembrane domain-containing protein [Thiolinea sp.]